MYAPVERAASTHQPTPACFESKTSRHRCSFFADDGAGGGADAPDGGPESGFPCLGAASQGLPQGSRDGAGERVLAQAEGLRGVEGGRSPIQARPGVRREVSGVARIRRFQKGDT